MDFSMTNILVNILFLVVIPIFSLIQLWLVIDFIRMDYGPKELDAKKIISEAIEEYKQIEQRQERKRISKQIMDNALKTSSDKQNYCTKKEYGNNKKYENDSKMDTTYLTVYTNETLNDLL